MAQWKLSNTSQTDVTAQTIVEFVLVKCDVYETPNIIEYEHVQRLDHCACDHWHTLPRA